MAPGRLAEEGAQLAPRPHPRTILVKRRLSTAQDIEPVIRHETEPEQRPEARPRGEGRNLQGRGEVCREEPAPAA